MEELTTMAMKGIYPRGKSFLVKKRFPGVQDRVHATFTTEAEAEAFILACELAIRTGKPLPTPDVGTTKTAKVMTVQDLYDRVDNKRWTGNPKSKSRGGSSVHNAKRYVQWVGPKVPVAEALTEDKIAEFVEWREDEFQNSGSTINRYTAAISALCKEAVKLKLIDMKPDMPKRDEGQCRIRFFTREEEKLIQQTVRQWSYDEVADWFAFLCDTGCRSGETFKLEWGDIIEIEVKLPDGKVKKIIHIHMDRNNTKNSTERTLTATPRVAEMLRRMRRTHSHQRGPWQHMGAKQRTVRTLWARLRGHFAWMDDQTVVYTFRHTCASWLVQKGIDLYRVQIWMGHKSMAMTQRYAKFAPKQLGELADALS
jgi:integrase